MKFFIDTANIDEIKKGLEMGMVDGVTTNPSLVAKEDKPFTEILQEICRIVDGPVSAEVVSLDADGMCREAKVLAAMSENIVIKIPMIVEGLKAVKRLTAEGIKTNVTLVFSSAQALLAAKAGATYVDTWEAFLDDRGQFAAYGPDVNGQFQKLRAGDGVHFTRPGARKLAHFVESEIRHALEDSRPTADPMVSIAPSVAVTPAPAGVRVMLAGVIGAPLFVQRTPVILPELVRQNDTLACVMPRSAPASDGGGLMISPSRTMKRFSPVHSLISPSVPSKIASS